MVIERVELLIKQGQEQAFETALTKGASIILKAQGSHNLRLLRGVEDRSKYILLIEWHDVASHESFTQTEAFEEFKSLVGDYYASSPSMEHFAPVELTI